jgi:hypothetical protein
MHLEVFVEESSAEAALGNLLPRILGPAHSFQIHPHQGKADLLGSLKARLRAYARWLPEDWKIVVVVDEDRAGCMALKARLEEIAGAAGFITKTGAGGGPFSVLNRIAIEELEAWFFGDVPAMVRAFPRIPGTLARRAPFRDPDAIAGGTWEVLERVLQRAGYFPGGMPKVETARAISGHMNVAANRSHSFRVFREGILACLA